MAQRLQFVNGEHYHIVNRAIEGKNLFRQIADYFRFIFCLYELNDKNMVRMSFRINQRKDRKDKRGQTPSNSREPLVEILAVCLMPTHYHLVVRQLADSGISLFMKKLGDSYECNMLYFHQSDWTFRKKLEGRRRKESSESN